jgi:chromosome segregation ATPase
MKTKAIIIALIILCIALAVSIMSVRKDAETQHATDVATIQSGSNQLIETTRTLDDEKQKNLGLEKDVAQRNDQLAKLTNDLSQTQMDLSNTQDVLKSNILSSKEEIARKDARISELETQKVELDKESLDLKSSITNLEGQIADTQKKLDASEGDKAFLTKELNRLMAEKADLEKKFNDLAVLRDQVKKLKEEISLARRLDWIRRGIFANADEKGAQRLMQPRINAASLAAPAPDLNVELKTDGSVKVIPPITNSLPPAAP